MADDDPGAAEDDADGAPTHDREASAGVDDPDDDRGDPLDDLAERVRRRRTEAAGAGDARHDPFGEEPFEALEGDGLWSAIEEDAGAGEAVAADEDGDEHVVAKRSYCERCRYLSDPPEVRCTHPGTTIVEFVDTERLRVRNCPVVAERLALGDTREGGMTPNTFGSR